MFDTFDMQVHVEEMFLDYLVNDFTCEAHEDEQCLDKAQVVGSNPTASIARSREEVSPQPHKLVYAGSNLASAPT